MLYLQITKNEPFHDTEYVIYPFFLSRHVYKIIIFPPKIFLCGSVNTSELKILKIVGTYETKLMFVCNYSYYMA